MSSQTHLHTNAKYYDITRSCLYVSVLLLERLYLYSIQKVLFTEHTIVKSKFCETSLNSGRLVRTRVRLNSTLINLSRC